MFRRFCLRAFEHMRKWHSTGSRSVTETQHARTCNWNHSGKIKPGSVLEERKRLNFSQYMLVQSVAGVTLYRVRTESRGPGCLCVQFLESEAEWDLCAVNKQAGLGSVLLHRKMWFEGSRSLWVSRWIRCWWYCCAPPAVNRKLDLLRAVGLSADSWTIYKPNIWMFFSDSSTAALWLYRWLSVSLCIRPFVHHILWIPLDLCSQ